MWMPFLLGGALALQPAVPPRECSKPATCSTITVPLDRSGVTPGTIPLAYSRIPATGPVAGTRFVIGGGPGQAVVKRVPAYVAVFPEVRAHHELVLIDQRGAGQSGAIGCSPEQVDAVTPCAARLGA